MTVQFISFEYSANEGMIEFITLILTGWITPDCKQGCLTKKLQLPILTSLEVNVSLYLFLELIELKRRSHTDCDYLSDDLGFKRD